MNPLDNQLDRLFRAAAQAESIPAATAPYGLETRVLAAWRAAQSTETGFWDTASLVRGLILASLIMAASCWPALTNTTNPFTEYLQLADSTATSDDAQ